MTGLSKIVLLLDKIRLLDLATKLKPPNLVVVAYHNVGPSSSSRHQTFEEPLPPALIEKQIFWLLRSGYIVTSLGDALNIINESPQKKVAAITFDDGYRGVYEYAYPILRKYNVKATLYITAGFVKYEFTPWWEQLNYIVGKARNTGKLRELTQLINRAKKDSLKMRKAWITSFRQWIEKIIRMMDAHELKDLITTISKTLGIEVPDDLYSAIMLNLDEIKEMVDYGFEVGGHGLWHVNLTVLSKDRLIEEVEESLNFTKTLYKGVYTFSYPFGIYDERVIKVLASKGFKAAVTLNPRPNQLPIINVYTIARIPPYRFNLKDIASFKWSLIAG